MEQFDLETLLTEIYNMPSSPHKIPVIEQAINLADTQNDLETAFDLRLELIYLATFHGHQLKALTAFSWCLAQVDKDNDMFDIEDILWEYKWICGSASDFYELNLDRINQLLADYKARIASKGYSMYSYQWLMTTYYHTINDLANMEKSLEQMKTLKRDSLGDCAACVQDGIVDCLLSLGKYQEALEAGSKILSGKMSCGEVPHMTYSALLLPALINGDFANAEIFYKKGYKLISKNPEFLSQIGNYALYLALIGDVAGALNLYKKHIVWSINDYALPNAKYKYHRGVAALFNNIKKDYPEVKIALPEKVDFFNPTGTYSTDALFNYHYQKSEELAKKFDARNGNKGYINKLNEYMLIKPGQAE